MLVRNIGIIIFYYKYYSKFIELYRIILLYRVVGSDPINYLKRKIYI